ncbi:tRNA pseudouridine(38-40) synthase TruA [Granulicella sp. 5B5]|uniref:tRNA pseudouridine(38-40) synthase TruA n=1 Tax=Granulicella sp. 5B5 TaxID=1617967 RepID=UPI0015F503BB|nr:tRNA pseudouridine(38-40) synthase TruA [Granulicella sp. 5B5]QMV17369.1 tRNA pseudouridine(38-40) synthase TruA [Granulicella sp. 5B5]
MSNWKLTLSYDGAPYHGWQIQPGLPTIQSALQQAIAYVTGEAVLPQGSGRTDTGVHALGQVASFTLSVPIPATNLLRALNRVLPPSIRVLAAQPMPPAFHARHSVLQKTYEYRIFERRITQPGLPAVERICSPFLAPYVWDCRWPLSLAPMEQAAATLCGIHDFTSFAASDPDLTQRTQSTEPGTKSDGPNPIKTIHASTITRRDDLLVYRVTGSGFLHHMVRNIVGTLTDVGRDAIAPTAIPSILAAHNRSAAGPTAPPQGLYLVQVDYPPHTEPLADGPQ